MPSIKRHICAENIMKCNATHVVVGIEWGSNSVVSIAGSEENIPNADDLKVCVGFC